MKKYFLFGLLITQVVFAQNLVPNGSFEEYRNCPDSLGQIRKGIVKHWQANPSTCTPDYFNACADRYLGVPHNQCGSLAAHEGQAYIGMILYAGESRYPRGHIHHQTELEYREHLQVKLLQPLKAHHQYRVRMYFALSDYANYAIQNIGILFTHFPLEIVANQEYAPQVVYNQEVNQLGKWILLEDTLVATGDEKFMVIGAFDNYENRKIRKISEDTRHSQRFNYNRAYYFFDDIWLEEIGLAPEIPPVKELITDFGKLKEGDKVVLQNIHFEYDRADLRAESFPELDKLVKMLKNFPKAEILILGHTDSLGTLEKNQELSQARAQSVKNYLLQFGIKESRISTRGLGETQPIATNATPAGQQLNRRVEFILRRVRSRVN
ncbi:MAG: OmpA family protein [Microscillaceae bacterium]|jgi:outer membrane protein OmpA-like peptidoglycan-associated protein|nr:OmpA family protein [Microscillaceae bacterium]